MAEPPPPPFPQRMPLLSLPLPQANSSPPKVPEPLPMPKVSVAAARLPTAPPPAAALPQAEPPPRPVAVLPQPRPPSPPFAALPQPPSPPVALPSSPRDHVARNPRIGDSGDVESGSGMSTPTVEALQEITLYVGAAAPVPQISKLHEEDGVADERDSTSLSDICARMIQSCTYTVEVKVCGGGTENSEDSTFSWDIVEGSSSSLNDLLASIAGTFPLFSRESIMIEYVDSIGGKNICVSNDEECLKMDKRKKKPSTKAILPCSIETENTLPLLPSPSYAIEDNVAKSKSSKTSSKSTRSKAISVAPDSPAMGTRSKKSVSPNSPGMSTRSKKRVVPNSQVMATRSKKKLKL